jgi:hypothetical protein
MNEAKALTPEEFAQKWEYGNVDFKKDFLSDLRSMIRGELIRYKIWENIFGGNYDTIEPMINDYLKSQRQNISQYDRGL